MSDLLERQSLHWTWQPHLKIPSEGWLKAGSGQPLANEEWKLTAAPSSLVEFINDRAAA